MKMAPLPKLNILGWLVVALVAFLLGWLIVSRIQLHRARSAAETNALAASNAIAERDVSRRAVLSAADAVRILGDSLAAVERLVVQSAGGLKRDALDKATDRTSVVRGGVTVSTGPVSTTAISTSSTVSASDVRSAAFHVDSSAAKLTLRFVADVDVKIPPPPAPATLALGVTFPPFSLAARQQCGPPDAAGVRPATLLVTAPVGISVNVDRFDADVHGCNPDFGRPGGIRVPLSVAITGALVSALVAVVLTR